MKAVLRYLTSEGAPSRRELSEMIGVSTGRFSQLERDNREGKDWPPELALVAEKETGGALDASELSSIIARARQVAA